MMVPWRTPCQSPSVGDMPSGAIRSIVNVGCSTYLIAPVVLLQNDNILRHSFLGNQLGGQR